MADRANFKLDVNSVGGGVAEITIAAGPASTAGADVACRSCLVKPAVGAAQMYINLGAAATTSSFPLDSTATPLPVCNLNQINVIGTAGEKLKLIYRF